MSSLERKLHVLLRHVGNRLCADCGQPLHEESNGNKTRASLSFQVFLCQQCADCHLSLFGHKTCIMKVKNEIWTNNEFKVL
jgi:hypothetical protein